MAFELSLSRLGWTWDRPFNYNPVEPLSTPASAGCALAGVLRAKH
jgi:hypothetical protein